MALRELFGRNTPINKIVVVRSVVQSRDIGFLPGNLNEKLKPYEPPLRAVVNDLCQRGDAWDILAGHDTIDFISTSFLRGLTIDNASDNELHAVLTRVGNNSKVIMSGDLHQTDLSGKARSGAHIALKVLTEIPSVKIITFDKEDVVRSGFVKDYIIKRTELEETNQIPMI
jgi:phosphate starvation-inducible protein PhoH